jgi:hypothetical protein
MQIFYQLQGVLAEESARANTYFEWFSRHREKKQGTQSDGGGSGFRPFGSNLENISGDHVSTIGKIS